MSLSSTSFGPVQPLGERRTIIGPARTFREAIGAGVALDAANFGHSDVECRGHALMHRDRVIALDEIRRVTVAAEERFQFVMRDVREV